MDGRQDRGPSKTRPEADDGMVHHFSGHDQVVPGETLFPSSDGKKASLLQGPTLWVLALEAALSAHNDRLKLAGSGLSTRRAHARAWPMPSTRRAMAMSRSLGARISPGVFILTVVMPEGFDETRDDRP